MIDLNENCTRLLQGIITAPLAWLTPEQLATRINLELDAVVEDLAELDLTGWIQPWELGDALYVTLTPHAAERLGVKLFMIGRSDGMRWMSIDEEEPGPYHASGRHEGITVLEFVADPSPGPLARIESNERLYRLSDQNAEASDTRWIDLLPPPRIFIGTALIPYPGPKLVPNQPCPACGSKPLPKACYCLVCDAWGMDYVLKAHKTHVAERYLRPSVPRQKKEDPRHAMAARKRKHLQKMAEKTQQATASSKKNSLKSHPDSKRRATPAKGTSQI
jgi:hypothetical protein